MLKNRLFSNLQFFSADTGGGAAATSTAGAGTEAPPIAGAGDTSAATGENAQGATGDTTAGGGEPATGAGLTEADIRRYYESDFLKGLGVDSIEAVKQALEAKGITPAAADATTATTTAGNAANDSTQAKDKAGDQGEPEGDKKEPEKKDEAKQPPAEEQPPPEEKKPEDVLLEKDSEIETLKAQLAAAKHDVDEEKFDDVLTLASALSKKGEGLEIGEAIKAIVEKYPAFTKSAAAAPAAERPRFGEVGSQRKADDTDPFVRGLFGNK